jgi:hypothetical protein
MLFTGYSRNVGRKTTLADVMDAASLWGVRPEDVTIEIQGDHIEISYDVPQHQDEDGWSAPGCVLCRNIGHDPSEPCRP